MALESCICLAQDKHHIPKTSQQLYRIAAVTSYCHRSGFAPFLFSSLSPFPQISLQCSSTDFAQFPEPVCTMCPINLLIWLSNNLTESTVFCEVNKLDHPTERSDDTQKYHKGRGWDMPGDRKEQNCPFQPQWIKISLLHPSTALAAYSQQDLFSHANPHMV